MAFSFSDEYPVLGPNTTVDDPFGAQNLGQLGPDPKVLGAFFEEVFIAAAANAVTQPVFTAPFPIQFIGVQSRFGTQSTSGTLQVEKTPSGTASGSGTNLLTGTIALSGTANTVVNGTLVSSSAVQLAKGDSISLVFGGTVTGLANEVVTLAFQRI